MVDPYLFVIALGTLSIFSLAAVRIVSKDRE